MSPHHAERHQRPWSVHLADSHHVLFREEFRAAAIEQAQQQGCLTSTKATMHEPDRKDVIIGDGTVPKCRFRSKTFDRLRKEGKALPGAIRYREGGEDGRWVQGMKELLFATRGDESPNTRVILGTFPVKESDYGGEAGRAVEEVLRFKEEIPGFLGFRFDGAFKGVHISKLIKAGLSVVSPMPKSDKWSLMYDVTCRNGHVHSLYTWKGDLWEAEMLDTGELQPVRLKRVGHSHNRPRRQGGNHRAYIEVELTCNAVHRERLDTTKDDEERGFNRSQRLRQHPPESEHFEGTYGYRADIESVNNNLDSSMYRQRMIVDTAERQALIMVGFCISRNAMSQTVHESRQREGLLNCPPGATNRKPVAA